MTAHDDVHQLLRRYEDALRRSDLEEILSCYTADAAVMAPNAPTAEGPAVRTLYEQILDALRLDITFEVDSVTLADDVAFALTHSTGTQTVVATGAKEPEANREAFLLVREGDAWRIRRYLFNTVR